MRFVEQQTRPTVLHTDDGHSVYIQDETSCCIRPSPAPVASLCELLQQHLLVAPPTVPCTRNQVAETDKLEAAVVATPGA